MPKRILRIAIASKGWYSWRVATLEKPRMVASVRPLGSY